ncbi:hypothetical protein K491DRAFT_713410 [Lophiostoma macrostomum CBS 122681]|uniref:DUF7730 domain-containing protein n=1 Tax=Lophiostoma macrostomum CBS 122681 TaxID=1314788 RepID=A0A6A6TJC7_9PLEO|nr:hypothetical protein K491DRAFT_713410 [Lophiostoma macrostomum CBS 122681]
MKNLFAQEREWVKYWRERKKHDIHPLPRWRKRALSLPREQPIWALLFGRTTRIRSLQEQCPLFKLPVEIRVIIWEEVLGGHEIVIENWPIDPALQKRPENWWAVPRTCRRLYIETINMLYSNTHIHVVCDDRGHNTLTKFRKSVLPHRWDQIHSLSIEYRLTPIYKWKRKGCVSHKYWDGDMMGDDQWPGFCKTLQTLPNLRTWRLKVYDSRHWLNEERLMMLRGIRASGTLALCTSFLNEEEREIFETGDLRHISLTLHARIRRVGID